MNDSNNTTEEFTRFYKINKNGCWHRKSPGGSYEEMKSKAPLKRLQLLIAHSTKRIE
jgi:hypothetical protein